MTKQYRLLKSAGQDLLEVARYVASKTDLEAADNLLTKIFETIIVIASHPEIGRSEERFGRGVLAFPSRKYKIYYKIRKQGISILHIFHSSRDQKKAWALKSPTPIE